MSVTLEDLWKNAGNEEILAAVARWESTNPQAQRALAAEVKRRGLDVTLPEVTAAPASAGSESSSTGKALVIFAVVLVAIAALAALVG